jgi:hypothetical protein
MLLGHACIAVPELIGDMPPPVAAAWSGQRSDRTQTPTPDSLPSIPAADRPAGGSGCRPPIEPRRLRPAVRSRRRNHSLRTDGLSGDIGLNMRLPPPRRPPRTLLANRNLSRYRYRVVCAEMKSGLIGRPGSGFVRFGQIRLAGAQARRAQTAEPALFGRAASAPAARGNRAPKRLPPYRSARRKRVSPGRSSW